MRTIKSKRSGRKVRVSRTGTRLAYAFCGLTLFVCMVSSCTVTRTITNESQYLQRGDTSVVIQTKTIESYNGQKH